MNNIVQYDIFFDELLIFSYILIKLTKKKYSETDLIIIMYDIYIVSEPCVVVLLSPSIRKSNFLFILMVFSAKKQSRKEDQEKKRLEALAKKKERDELAAQEEKETLSKIVKVNPVKQTQARIREETERREIAAKKASTKPELETHLSKPIEVNVNR